MDGISLMYKTKKIFGDNIHILEVKNDKTVIDYCPNTGKGIMNVYNIMPGVILSFIEFNTESSLNIDRGIKNVWEINYCIKGRFECEFSNNTFAYVGEGDFAVNSMENIPKISSFPLGMYLGVSIYIDIDLVSKNLSKVLETFSIDLDYINNKLNLKNQCYICKATSNLKHIFKEIYENKETININYIRIKIIELLFSLSTINDTQNHEEKYYTKNQVNKVKHIRDHMVEHDDIRFSLEKLTSEHYISLSLFKSCFKKIYGDSPYSYIRKYKMNKAAALLETNNSNINEVALSLGYRNASKFSKAFKDVIGMLPSEYKKKIK